MAKKPFEVGGIAETNTFVDASDTTKSLSIDVGGTTGVAGVLATAFTTAKTITFPDATDTLVGRATTDTLTNKTLTSPTLTTPVLGTPASGTLTNTTGLPLTTGVTGTLPIANGGTNITTYASGDILYASATNTLSKLVKGTDGQILTLASGVPSWAAAPITLPSQSGNSGKYLTTDGTNASWGTLVVPITTGTSTVLANTATTIDTTALSAFTSIEYMVSLKQDSKIRTSKVVVQTDGTSVDMTEFAITETGGTIAGVVVSAAVSSTNAVLQLTATDAATTNVTVKFSKVAL
jgi:hypothetical protein